MILPLLFLSACGPGTFFEDYKPVGDNGWHKDSAVVFHVVLKDTVHPFNVYVNIRNRGNYPNSNIWLFVSIKSPDGRLLKDTVEFILADSSGKWKGSGIGDLFDNQFVYKKDVYFPVPGEYLFSVRQGMREKELQGIRDIGIRLEKENNRGGKE